MFNSVTSKVTSTASKVVSSVPVPFTTKEETSFSEAEALKHVNALSQMASQPAASADQNPALQYVLKECESIKETAHGDFKVEVDVLPAKSGGSNRKNVALKFLPKREYEEDILVSAHIDPVFSAEGAGDDSSSVAVMLELARGLSKDAHGFHHAVIFFFNGEEEEGRDGSHSFMTKPLFGEKTIRLGIDLDSFGLGGNSKDALSSVFLYSHKPHGDATGQIQRQILDLEEFSKYPSGHITAQDIFSSDIIKSDTDFQTKMVDAAAASGLGLDFAFKDRTDVYHTKDKRFELLKPGSLQHLGENMLAFLLQTSHMDFN